MKDPRDVLRLSSASLRLALLASLLVLTAGTSRADRDEDRGSWRNDRTHERGGARARSDGGRRGFNDDRARTRGGDQAADRMDTRGFSDRRFKFGDRTNGEGSVRGFFDGLRANGGRGRAFGDDARKYAGRDRGYDDRTRTYGGRDRWYGGGSGRAYWGGGGYGRGAGWGSYGGPGYCAPNYGGRRIIRYARPRSYVSFGIGLGASYYCPPSYRAYARHAPIVREYESQIDVENEPPAGCYYYDPFCEREFLNLDDYTDHIDHEGHAKTIEIIERDSGEPLRTLEFVDGYWSVQP